MGTRPQWNEGNKDEQGKQGNEKLREQGNMGKRTKEVKGTGK